MKWSAGSSGPNMSAISASVSGGLARVGARGVCRVDERPPVVDAANCGDTERLAAVRISRGVVVGGEVVGERLAGLIGRVAV